MTVIVVERVSASLRGELTRWLLEPHTGIFVGRPSAMVRDRLWEMVCKGARTGGAILITSASTEQGFTVRMHGDTARQLRDFDGVWLVQIPK